MEQSQWWPVYFSSYDQFRIEKKNELQTNKITDK